MCTCKCFGCTRKSRIFLCFARPQPGWGLRCDEKLIIRSDWQAAQSPRGDDSERGYDACHRRGAPRKSKILLRSTKSKLIFHKRQTASLVEAFLVALLGSDSWQRMCASTLPHTHSRMYLHPHSHSLTHTRRSLQTLACTEAAINFQCALYAPPLRPRPGAASGRNGERRKAC